MSAMSGLQVAVDLALGKRDAAAQLLAQARQTWIAAQLQLDQLENYAQETTARWSKQLASCTPELMRHHYQFMERLNHAAGLQTGIVAERARTVSSAAFALREAECRLESLRQVHAARERELRMALGRREQKQSDEQAALQYRRLAGEHAGEGLR